MAHTPGPWTVQNLEPGTIGHDWVDGPDRRFVAVCHEILGNGPHGYGQHVDTDEIAANARLIAAAPDLLLAVKLLCEEMADYMKINNLGDPNEKHNYRLGMAAIARAEDRS